MKSSIRSIKTVPAVLTIVFALSMVVHASPEPSTPEGAIIQQIGEALAAGNPQAARDATADLLARREAALETALTLPHKARNTQIRKAAQASIPPAAELLETIDYSIQSGVPVSVEDWARIQPGLQPSEAGEAVPDGETAGTSTLRLLPQWVLRSEPDWILWTLPASMRAPREGYSPSPKAWVTKEDGSPRLRYRLAAESVDGFEADAREDAAVSLSLAAGEYEPFQIVLTPKSADLDVRRVWIADFKSKDGKATISADNVEISLVGYVWGADFRGDRDGWKQGPYADVLFPNGHQSLAEKGKNYTLWFTVHAPAETPPGDYTSLVTLELNDKAVTVPVRLHVWDFQMPAVAPIATSLFGFNSDNHMSYWYEVAPWEDKAQKIRLEAMELFARHRFSPYIPPFQRTKYETFPEWAEGRHGRGLLFEPERGLTLASPRFDTMLDGFTLSFWLKAGAEGLILNHRYSGRPSGYWAEVKDGKLFFTLGYGTDRGRPPQGSDIPESMDNDDAEEDGDDPKPTPTPTKASLTGPPVQDSETIEAPLPNDGAWHHIAFRYDAETISLFIDGKEVAKKDTSRPFRGSWTPLRLGGGTAEFSIDDLRWFDSPLSAGQIVSEMESESPVNPVLLAHDFEDPKYDFASKRSKLSPEELDDQWFWQWVNWAKERGLHLSGLPTTRDFGEMPAFVEKYYRPLKDNGMLERGFVRLPNDEAYGTERAEFNQRWAAELQKLMPEIRTHQTLGVMGGSRSDWATRDKHVREYHGLADIYAMRPLILEGLWENNFKPRVEAGDEMAPYIHAQCWMTSEGAPLAGRQYFWNLKKFGARMCTLWITNLWFQAIRPDGRRAERRTWEEPWGFRVTQRNADIGDGTIVWPGKDGVLSSIRAASWRDGIEDYAYFDLLETRLAKARAAGAPEDLLTRAQGMLDMIAALPTYGRHWEATPDKESTWLLGQRERIARLIEELAPYDKKSIP